jgi:manganese transport protein
VLWFLCEIAIVACDLAEVIGSAVALNLLFGIPLPIGAALTALDVLFVLSLKQGRFRLIELVVFLLILVVGGCMAFELFLAKPSLGLIARNLLPSTTMFSEPGSLYIAVGILGATVMPHNLYLHSSVVQTRHFQKTPEARRSAVRYATVDSALALSLAFFVNASILILAASAFYGGPSSSGLDLGQAYKLLSPTLGVPAASVVFAIALLASGQNSTLTGTLAGQIVMEGFLRIQLKPWMRRLLTRLVAVVPAVVVTSLWGRSGVNSLLILSQVILSMQLGFAIVPLILFTSDRSKMGDLANGRLLKLGAWLTGAVIIGLNAWLLGNFFFT